MGMIRLRLRLAYNRWYLAQLQQKALGATFIAPTFNVVKAIREQKDLIRSLEELVYEDCNAK